MAGGKNIREKSLTKKKETTIQEAIRMVETLGQILLCYDYPTD